MVHAKEIYSAVTTGSKSPRESFAFFVSKKKFVYQRFQACNRKTISQTTQSTGDKGNRKYVK